MFANKSELLGTTTIVHKGVWLLTLAALQIGKKLLIL